MPEVIIIAKATGYPKDHDSSGITLKFIPHRLAKSVGGSKITETTDRILMMSFWRMLTKPRMALSKKEILFDANAT